MKIFMHWDMEGTCGIFNRELVWYWEEGVSEETARQGRELLVADVNSAVRAALDAGVDEIIVSDTHRGGGNLTMEKMLVDPRVSYNRYETMRTSPRVTYNQYSRGFDKGVYRWMPGLDESVDGFMVPAHHAKAGTANAFLPHTNNGTWADFSINGVSLGEMGEEACFAAHWGIPLIMTHGDETFCREVRATYLGVVAVPVKRALDPEHCTGPDLETAHKLVAEGIHQAIENLRAGRCTPFAPKLPMTVTIRLKDPADADAAVAKHPDTIQRVDEFTLQGHVERYCDVMKWFSDVGLDMPAPD